MSATAATTAPPLRVHRILKRKPYGALSILTGLVLWEVLVRIFQPSELVIVAPTEILATLIDMLY